MPARKDTLEIFLKFEKYFPRYKKMRYEADKAIRHKEKNYYSHVIMDAQELVLKAFFTPLLDELAARGIAIEKPTFVDFMEAQGTIDGLDMMDDFDVDSVGSVVKRKAFTSMDEVDFSLGRVNVRELQRKMAIESEAEERISSVDSSETLKEKGKKEKQESFH